MYLQSHQVQMKNFTLPSTYIFNNNYEFGQVYHNLDQSKIVLELQKDQAFVKSFETSYQGRHGWQSPQGLGLAWILQNRKRQRQWQQAADVSITVAALIIVIFHQSRNIP